MNRPMYETKKDLDNEKEVAKKLGKAWGGRVQEAADPLPRGLRPDQG